MTPQEEIEAILKDEFIPGVSHLMYGVNVIWATVVGIEIPSPRTCFPEKTISFFI